MADRHNLFGLGCDLLAQRLVVVKSAQHFHAAFAPIARAIVYVGAPGAASPDLSSLGFRRIQRPKWPLDPIAPHATPVPLPQRLKAALWFAVGRIVDEETARLNRNATPQFIGALMAMVWTQLGKTPFPASPR